VRRLLRRSSGSQHGEPASEARGPDTARRLGRAALHHPSRPSLLSPDPRDLLERDPGWAFRRDRGRARRSLTGHTRTKGDHPHARGVRATGVPEDARFSTHSPPFSGKGCVGDTAEFAKQSGRRFVLEVRRHTTVGPAAARFIREYGIEMLKRL